MLYTDGLTEASTGLSHKRYDDEGALHRPASTIVTGVNLSVLSKTGVVKAARGYVSRIPVRHRQPIPEGEQQMIVLGVILILVGYLLPVPAIIATIGWILLVIGVVLLILGRVGRPVGGRRYWY